MDEQFHTYVADGLALQAKLVVLADGTDRALKIAKAWCDENGVQQHTLRLMEITKPKEGVIYGWNGDY